MNLTIMFLVFILGVFIGSIYNKIGKNLPNNELIFKKVKCSNCAHEFAWYERIPLFSYFACSGRCSSCRVRLNTLEIVNELFTGLLFTATYSIFGFSYQSLICLGIISMFMIVLVSDLTYYVIPDSVLACVNIFFILILLFNVGVYDTLMKITSGLFLFGVMYLIMIIGNFLLKKESLGGGDIKMMFTFGLLLGPIVGLFSIFLSSFIALPVSLLLLKSKNENIIPFGPFLLISLLILYFIQLDTYTLLNLISF